MTWDHIEREFHRSPNALEVTFKFTDGRTETGIFLQPNGTKIVILTRKREFLVFARDEAKPVDFHRTPWKVKETQKQIFNVTADSLNRWLALPCISAQAQSLTEFFWWEGPLLKAGKFADFKYSKGVSISTNTQDIETVKTQLQQLQKQDELQKYLDERAQWRPCEITAPYGDYASQPAK